MNESSAKIIAVFIVYGHIQLEWQYVYPLRTCWYYTIGESNKTKWNLDAQQMSYWWEWEESPRMETS